MRIASWPAVVAVALIAGVVPGAATTAAAASAAGPAAARAGAVTNDDFALNAVSADSSSDAWAVGDGDTVLRWDGTSWTQVSLPGSQYSYSLNAVDALSPSDVWAVGTEGSSSPLLSETLIMHWDGTGWTQVPSPGPSSSNLIPTLNYLSMDSATDGWAMGDVYNRTTGGFTTLVAHWDGTSWQQVTAKAKFAFRGVASFSPAAATAVGAIQTGEHTFSPTVAYQWNGTSWARTATLHAPSGVSASSAFVIGLSADSATDMWAIGGDPSGNLVWHWNGTHWTVKAVISPNGTAGLLGVAAISSTDVWTVGYTNAAKDQQTVSLHWNGTGWTHVTTPDPGTENAVLNGVAAAGSSVWAVGSYNTGPQQSEPHTLILSWNGTSWVRS